MRLCLIQAGRNDTPAFISAQPWSLILHDEPYGKLMEALRRIAPDLIPIPGDRLKI